MFNVTTKYDKIGNERKKVFMIRGEESYARTVDVVMTYTETGTDNIQGFPVTFNVTLYRNLGDSQLVFYDGEEPIGTVTTHEYTQQYTFSTRLSWGADHKIWVQYKANKQTLGKKSKSVSFHKAIPSSYVPTITFTSGTQINEGASYTATGNITFLGESVADGTAVDISLDGTLINTVFTENGAFSCSVGNLAEGKHTVTAETLQSEVMNAKAQNRTVHSGYDISFSQASQRVVDGVTYVYKILVKNFNGTPISGASVSFANTTQTTDSNGIATFTLLALDTGLYLASCGGSYSEYLQVENVTPSPIKVSSSKPVTKTGTSIPINVSVVDGGGLKVSVTENGVSKPQLTLDSQGKATYTYRGTGAGKIHLEFTDGFTSDSIDIYDCLLYESSKWGKALQIGATGVGKISHQNNQLQFIGQRNAECELKPMSYIGGGEGNVLEFDIVELSSTIDNMPTDSLYLEVDYGNVLMVMVMGGWSLRSSIKFKYDDGSLYYWKNGELVDVYTIEDEIVTQNKYWKFINRDMLSQLNLKLDNIKVYIEE